ncbi:MAG: hypothetical protein Q8880_01785 [Bacteroidota bacterium]|nr:hypothetical protein [Bacteroidota bacterium]
MGKLYCKCWLEMSVEKVDGTIVEKEGHGTPQGRVIGIQILFNKFFEFI